MILKDTKRHLSARSRQHSVKGFPTERKDWTGRTFLTIAPALPGIRTQTPRLGQRSASTVSSSRVLQILEPELEMPPRDVILFQAKPMPSRSQKDVEKNCDRISLDRRGLTHLPTFIADKGIRLLSLQHNLINRLDAFPTLGFNKLVFLDLYNNQVEKISGLESLENLRVLLFGKNRIKKMEGLKTLTKLEVLDLHGNQINQISGLQTLAELKVLNLAGNQIRMIEESDLEGMLSLQELNLKRNRLRKIADLGCTPQLEKLFLSNNEILSVEDMTGICRAFRLQEVTIDSNPVAVSNECVHLLVSFLPNLQVLSHMQVTEQVRKNAMLWRKNRENITKVVSPDLKNSDAEARRAEVISNAKTNWDLLRKQSKCLPPTFTTSSLKDLRVLEEYDSKASKTIQSDSVLSVASSITLSSRDSLTTSKTGGSRKSFANRRSFSEDATDLLESDVDYFKLPPILASLANEKGSTASDSSGKVKKIEGATNSEKNVERVSSSDVSEETGGHPTDDSADESENAEGEREGKRSKSARHPRRGVASKKERPFTAKGKSKQTPLPAPGKVREQGGDYLIEICGRCLNVYGQGALRFIDRPWNPTKAGDVTTVRFNYVTFGGISNVLGKLKQRFPNAENFIFRETNITYLGQLNALADVQGLSSLQIDEEGNPISEKNWRNYAIYRLAHWGLKTINGKEVTEEELAEVAQEYRGLSDLVLWSLPDSLLQPLLGRLRIDGSRSNPQQTAKQWLWNVDPALRSVVGKEALQWRRGTQDDLYWRHKGKTHLSHILEMTCAAVDKLQILEKRWPSILNQLILDTLVDYSQMESYMKKCMQELQ